MTHKTTWVVGLELRNVNAINCILMAQILLLHLAVNYCKISSMKYVKTRAEVEEAVMHC